MARIRSIHPGLFTDEAFVSLSMAARVFLIGVWTDADDHGVFEWKPISLKMRLFPADNIDAGALLSELSSSDQVRKVEHGGKEYGIIRNFCKWQRPKKPTYKHPFPPEWGTYVALKVKGSPPVPHQSPTSGGKSAQRKEEGGRRNEVGGKNKGGGVESRARARAERKPLDPQAETGLLAGPLLKQFIDAYPAKVSKAAEKRFRALVMDGENADPIIAAAPHANPDMPAEQWLDERAWTQLSMISDEPAPKVVPGTISPDALALADELARIAGQDPDFLEPGWCGAAYRCQQWLDQGYPRELIVAGIKSMVAAKAPEKIDTVAYFEKGLARFIAKHTKPVPKIINQEADTVEVSRETDRERYSAVAATGRVYDKLRAQEQHRRGRAVPGDAAKLLPPGPIHRS